MAKYEYKGPVMRYGRVIKEQWIGETTALSKEKAMSNLTYRFKKQNNLIQATKVTLLKNKIHEVSTIRRA